MVGAGLARPPAGWPSEVGGALGLSASEGGALRLAGAQRGKGVLKCSAGLSGAERSRPVADERRPGLWIFYRYSEVGHVFMRDALRSRAGENEAGAAFVCPQE